MRFRLWSQGRLTSIRRSALGAAALVVSTIAGTALINPSPASAATDTVTNCNNTGAGSLRQTVANATSGDTIDFALPRACSTITLSSTIDVSTTLTIDGPGASRLAVSGGHAVEVCDIASGVTVSISGLTVKGGFSGSVGVNGLIGGGIYNSGTLNLTNSTITGNSTGAGRSYSVGTGSAGGDGGDGGGIYNVGTLNLTNSTISKNTAGAAADCLQICGRGGNGGGIYNGGMLNVTNSTISGNSAGAAPMFATPGNGGGIFTSDSTNVADSTLSGDSAGNGGGIYGSALMIITNSTISGDSAGNGGGIFTSGSTNVADSTLSGNSAPEGGGGIDNGGTLTINNSTLASNSAINGDCALPQALVGGGGGIDNGGTLTINNSTLASNSAAQLCGGMNFTGGGIYGPATLETTILADGSGGNCKVGSVSDNGYNIDTDGSCGFMSPSISDYATVSATLGSLANNGGPTQTIALPPGKPGIDYVPSVDCPLADQRGFTRTAPCDVGAYDTDHAPVVSASGVQITTTSLLEGFVGADYSQPLTATGGNHPYTWKLARGSAKLPKGLKLNKRSGIISGMPKATAHSSTFTVEVLDKKIKLKHQHATQHTATKVFSITIS